MLFSDGRYGQSVRASGTESLEFLLFRADEPEVLTPALRELVLARLRAYAEIEQELGEAAVSPPQMLVEEYDPQAVERYAGEVRDFLEVSHAPLGDVIARLEDRGLKILFAPLPGKVSGVSVFTESLGAGIIINDSHPVERQFFTALHGLAHLIFHRQVKEAWLPAAQALKKAGLSLADLLCLYYCSANGHTLLSNDKRLRRACKENGVVACGWCLSSIAG